MKLVSHNVKFIIKVTCLGLYMHHLVFWNKLLSGKSICIFKVFNCLYELEQYIISCNNVRIVDKSIVRMVGPDFHILYVGND